MKKIKSIKNNNIIVGDNTALDVAKYLVFLADFDKNNLTNLHLQKLLYYAWGCYWKLFQKHLFKNNIEAWRSGAVVREVFLKYCDRENEKLFSVHNYKTTLNEEVQVFLKNFYEEYKKYKYDLLARSIHLEEPWLNNYKINHKNIIAVKELESFFNKMNNK